MIRPTHALRALIAAVIVLIAAAPGVAAAVTVGSAQATVDSSITSQGTYVQSADGTGQPSYAIPAGAGVVTGWKARVGASTGATPTFKLKVVRPGASSQFTLVGETSLSITGVNAYVEASAQARIPVQAGDRLAVFVPSGAAASSSAATGSAFVFGAGDATGTFSTTSAGPNARLNVEATVERDADGDGFGDETQDACPGDPTRQTPPCVTDLALSASSSTPQIAVGGVATIVVNAGAASSSPALGVVASIVVPAGLEVLAASTTGGECAGAGTLSCAFGEVPGGGVRKAFLVLRGTAAGPATVVAAGQSENPDSTPANNTTTLTLSVTPAPVATQTKLCKVPSLRGQTLAAARTRLTRAGCALGRRSGAKGSRARVRSQGIPAGTQVLAGTKVALTFALPKATRRR